MGFFSKCCAKTNLPIVSEARGYPELSEVVVLFPNGAKMAGIYDGYGRVDGQSLCPDGYDDNLWDQLKFVLKSHYNDESYWDLGSSGDEMAQGYFMADEFLDHCLQVGKFKNRQEYTRAFSRLAQW